MKTSKNITRAVLFGVLIFLAALVGPRVAHGYIHPADPLIVLAAMLLPAPHALIAAGVASVAVDLLKGLYLLSPATLIIKLLMVLAVKGLLKTKPAQKFPELMASLAALIPVPGYYLSELIYQLIRGQGAAAFSAATVTLRSDLIQAGASVLLFVFIYDLYKGIKAGREEVRRLKAENQEERQE